MGTHGDARYVRTSGEGDGPVEEPCRPPSPAAHKHSRAAKEEKHAREHCTSCKLRVTETIGTYLWTPARRAAPECRSPSRCRDSHSAAPPSTFCRCINSDGEKASAKRQSRQWLVGPLPEQRSKKTTLAGLTAWPGAQSEVIRAILLGDSPCNMIIRGD